MDERLGGWVEWGGGWVGGEEADGVGGRPAGQPRSRTMVRVGEGTSHRGAGAGNQTRERECRWKNVLACGAVGGGEGRR